jgi:hypothetical protein
VYTLVTLYVSAVLGWIETFRRMVPFAIMAAAAALSGRCVNKQLTRRLAELHEELVLSATTLDIIEDDYLHERVMPNDWRELLDPRRLDFFPVEALARHVRNGGRKRLDAAALREQARTRVEALLATARASADLTPCHELLFTFARERLTILRLRHDWNELIPLARDSAENTGDRTEEVEKRPAKPRIPKPRPRGI